MKWSRCGCRRTAPLRGVTEATRGEVVEEEEGTGGWGIKRKQIVSAERETERQGEKEKESVCTWHVFD